jgi:hypothetical protein
MNIYELARLVVKMRNEQKEYFINHSRIALNKAKLLEKQVDIACLQILNSLPEQRSLLDPDSGTSVWVKDE